MVTEGQSGLSSRTVAWVREGRHGTAASVAKLMGFPDDRIED